MDTKTKLPYPPYRERLVGRDPIGSAYLKLAFGLPRYRGNLPEVRESALFGFEWAVRSAAFHPRTA
jgi:hypothetical protein